MLNFIRTTILGGIVFLLPFAVLAFLAGKIVAMVRPVVEPVSKQLPLAPAAGFSVTLLLAIIVLVLVSFLAGVLAKTRIAQHLAKEVESRVLGRVPVYSLLKSMSRDLVAPEASDQMPVVLVRFDDCRQIAVKMGETDGGATSIVYVPDSPTPQTGAVLFVASDRVERTDLTIMQAYAALARRGVGLGEQIPAPA